MFSKISKSTKWLSMFMLSVLVAAAFTSCKDDDKDASETDPASVITGTYIGTGKLMDASLGGVEYDSYPGMKLVITRSSNEYVIITPYEADGSPFFASDKGDVFRITKTATGDYMLTSSNLPLVEASITKSGNIQYYYPYVSVGGTGGFALSFNGRKE